MAVSCARSRVFLFWQGVNVRKATIFENIFTFHKKSVQNTCIVLRGRLSLYHQITIKTSYHGNATQFFHHL